MSYLRDNARLCLLLFTHHSIGLASTCLPIGKYTDVVALEGMFQHLLSNIIVHAALGCKAGVIRLYKEKINDILSYSWTLRYKHCSGQCHYGNYLVINR